ncbi:unnamed protein product [Meganyctiphanes norvegica]|uniref:Carbohydrate sulfotransferase n=1 Tax=Meganyctiphanes norvegica TaxID=48144 RepID=A0AAV2QZG3_MEGNR
MGYLNQLITCILLVMCLMVYILNSGLNMFNITVSPAIQPAAVGQHRQFITQKTTTGGTNRSIESLVSNSNFSTTTPSFVSSTSSEAMLISSSTNVPPIASNGNTKNINNMPAITNMPVSIKKSKIQEVGAWEKQISSRFKQRTETLKKACASISNAIGNQGYTINHRLYFAKGILSCLIAKVGTSTWKTHLLDLVGNKKEGWVHKPSLTGKIKAKKRLTSSQLNEFIHPSTKYKSHLGKVKQKVDLQGSKFHTVVRVMTVRHPLVRLISAYREKYLGGNNITYGVHKGTVDEVGFSSKRFHSSLMKTVGMTAVAGDIISFNFTQFLMHITRKGNPHWAPFYTTCSPCQLDYDYILHLETFEDDLAYVYQRVGISTKNANKKVHETSGGSSDLSLVNSYFRDQPDQLLERVYHIYETDLKLFGYAIPEFFHKFDGRDKS